MFFFQDILTSTTVDRRCSWLFICKEKNHPLLMINLLKRICKAHNMSFSMIRSCVKDYGLICLFENSITANMCKHSRAYHVNRNNQTSRSSNGRVSSKRDWTVMDKSIGSEQRYQMMLENLRAQSSKPNIIKNMAASENTKKDKRVELKGRVSQDKKIPLVPPVPPVTQALVPSLLLTKYRFHSRISDDLEYVLEVGHPIRKSESYNRFCIQLEIPYCLGEGFLGHKTLLKLCKATREGESIYKNHASRHVIEEVFKVAADDLKLADKTELMDLLFCRYVVKDFPINLYKKLFVHFDTKMRNDEIKMDELIRFINRFQSCYEGGPGSQKKDINVLAESIGCFLASNSSRPLSILKEVYNFSPSEDHAMVSVLNKLLKKKLDKLDVCEAFLIYIEIHSRARKSEVKYLSSWISKNLDEATMKDVQEILPGVMKSPFNSELLLDLFDKVLISTPLKDINTDVLMQILSYCTITQCYNDSVLETACDHYIVNQNWYTSQQLHTLLKAIGTLNFTPEKCEDFFTKVSKIVKNIIVGHCKVISGVLSVRQTFAGV